MNKNLHRGYNLKKKMHDCTRHVRFNNFDKKKGGQAKAKPRQTAKLVVAATWAQVALQTFLYCGSTWMEKSIDLKNVSLYISISIG